MEAYLRSVPGIDSSVRLFGLPSVFSHFEVGVPLDVCLLLANQQLRRSDESHDLPISTRCAVSSVVLHEHHSDECLAGASWHEGKSVPGDGFLEHPLLVDSRGERHQLGVIQSHVRRHEEDGMRMGFECNDMQWRGDGGWTEYTSEILG